MFFIQLCLLLYPTLTLSQDLPYLSLGATDGVSTSFLQQADNTASTAIAIPNGFLFGGNNETTVFVSSNGLFSFREAVAFCCPQDFPSQHKYIVAPYWADNDIRNSGTVSYEVHTRGSSLINTVNNFLNNQGHGSFSGTWMLIADWNQVPEHPGTGYQTNTYQGILITNGTHSYTIFIYQCGMMQWSGEATIGFYSDGHFYENHYLTGSPESNLVACLTSSWSNILYLLHSPYELDVRITTDPPGPVYPAGVLIYFSCHTADLQPVNYDWIFYCTAHGANQIVATLQDLNETGVYTVRLPSTLTSACVDTVVCLASDSSGKRGASNVSIANVTGAGLFVPDISMSLANNSAFIADSAGQFETINCHSASRQSDIGQWVSPSGSDITFNFSDPFDIRRQSGNFQSYIFLKLGPGYSVTAAEQGVYSCVIPDENGVVKILSVGIYPNDYQGQLKIISARRVSEHPLVLACTSTGLPATVTTWQQGATTLSNEDSNTFTIHDVLDTRTTTTYSTYLETNAPFNEVVAESMFFHCYLRTFNQNGTDYQSDIHFFTLDSAGDSNGIQCTVQGASTYRWMHRNMIVSSSDTYHYTVTDRLHNEVLTCLGYNDEHQLTGSLNITVIVHVPDDIITVSIGGDMTTVDIGESKVLQCIITDSSSGSLANGSVIPQWLDSMGNLLQTGNGIFLSDPTIQSSSHAVTRDLSFTSLQTSQAGLYSCQGTLDSVALDSALVKTEEIAVRVQIPPPVVNLEVPSFQHQIVYAGESLELSCNIGVSELVDITIHVSIIWKRNSIKITESDSRYRLLDTQYINEHMYQAQLVITTLSSSLDTNAMYSCEAYLNGSSDNTYVVASSSASDTITIAATIAAPLLSAVSVDPTSASILDVEPYNSLCLVCNATSEPATVPKTFQWERRLDSSSSQAVVLEDNGNSVVIASQTNYSKLTVVMETAGTYFYTCTARIQIPEDSDIEASTNAMIIVRGPEPPSIPTNISVKAITSSSNSAIISWSAPALSYTPETYIVEYGTDPNSLDQQSVSLSSDGISTERPAYSVSLTGLIPETTYYFKIVITNTYTTTDSETGFFTTGKPSNCEQVFQLVLTPIHDCNDWRFDNTDQKVTDVISALLSGVNMDCRGDSCPLELGDIDGGEFQCNVGMDNSVTFRAVLVGQVCRGDVAAIEFWVSKGDTSIVVDSNRLSVDPGCAVRVESITSEVECTEESKLWLYVGIGGGAGGTVILILLIIVFAGIFFFIRKPKKRTRRSTMLEDRASRHSTSRHGNPPTDIDLENIYYRTHGGGAMAPLTTFIPPVPSRPDPMGNRDSVYVKMDPAMEDGDGQYEELAPDKAWHIQYEMERASDGTLVNEGEYASVS